MNPTHPILTAAVAIRRGYRPLTHPYHPGTEDWMLVQTIMDCRRVGADIVLVRERCSRKIGDWEGTAVWRKTFRPR